MVQTDSGRSPESLCSYYMKFEINRNTKWKDTVSELQDLIVTATPGSSPPSPPSCLPLIFSSPKPSWDFWSGDYQSTTNDNYLWICGLPLLDCQGLAGCITTATKSFCSRPVPDKTGNKHLWIHTDSSFHLFFFNDFISITFSPGIIPFSLSYQFPTLQFLPLPLDFGYFQSV